MTEISPRDLKFLELLKLQFKQKKLASFYLISSPQKNLESDYENTFIQKWLTSSNILFETHADLWSMDLEDGVSVDEIKELIKFTQMRPSLLPYKFLIIKSAERLDEIHLNKLLKTLENPDGESVIFFFTKHKSIMPKTIVGRAFCWSLQNLQNNNTREIKFKTYQDAANALNQLRIYCEASRYKNIPGPIDNAWQTLLAKT